MRFGFLSTYPPTQCGLATFTRALAGAIEKQPGCSFEVVRSLERPEEVQPKRVIAQLVAGDRLSQRRAAEALNRTDVAIVQHEYGIYGGPDGAEVLAVLRQLRVPAIVVLHTVLTRPSDGQRQVLEAVCAEARAVVTMSRAARNRLISRYTINPGRVIVIPHGAVPARGRPTAPVPGRILTWGLLGPGKGIEWGVRALAELMDVEPRPHYLVSGQIHPKVAERQGERYRDSLRTLADSLGVSGRLEFDPAYRPTEQMPELIASAEVVLLPYDSDEQVTSGVLIEAVAAGRPVVATRFPHAVELLAGGSGTVVPHRDPEAMAAALRSILTDRELAAGMASAARSEAARLDWVAVGRQYVALGRRLTGGTTRQYAGNLATR